MLGEHCQRSLKGRSFWDSCGLKFLYTGAYAALKKQQVCSIGVLIGGYIIWGMSALFCLINNDFATYRLEDVLHDLID